MKKIILLLVAILLSCVFVSAQVDLSNIDLSKADLNVVCAMALDSYNINGAKVPWFVPFSNEVFNLYGPMDAAVGSFVLKDKVVAMTCSEADKPTYNIYVTNYQLIDDIKKSNKPIGEINNKIKNGEIKIVGVGISQKFKWFLAKLMIKLGALFA